MSILRMSKITVLGTAYVFTSYKHNELNRPSNTDIDKSDTYTVTQSNELQNNTNSGLMSPVVNALPWDKNNKRKRS